MRIQKKTREKTLILWPSPALLFQNLSCNIVQTMSRGVESLRIPKKKNIKKFTADGSAKKKIIGKQDKYEKKKT